MRITRCRWMRWQSNFVVRKRREKQFHSYQSSVSNSIGRSSVSKGEREHRQKPVEIARPPGAGQFRQTFSLSLSLSLSLSFFLCLCPTFSSFLPVEGKMREKINEFCFWLRRRIFIIY